MGTTLGMRTTTVAAGLLLAVLAVPAVAAPGDGHECVPCGHHGPRVTGCDVLPARSCDLVPVHGCRLERGPARWRRAPGTSWSVIRSRLRGGEYVRRHYIRGYFLRRYGVLFADAGQYGVADDEGDGGWLLADGREEGAAPVDAIDRLNRGMARFHHADYAQARADFGAVLAQRPDLAAARVGRALTAVIAADWPAAAADLGRLAQAGELRPDDRLLLAEAFADPSAPRALLDGTRAWLRVRPGDGDAELVAGWLLTLLDETDAARAHLERATPGVARSALAPRTPPDAAPRTAPARPDDAAPLAPPRLPAALAADTRPS